MGPRSRADARLRNWVLEGGRRKRRATGAWHPLPAIPVDPDAGQVFEDGPMPGPSPWTVLVFALGMLAGLALMGGMLAAVGVRGWR